MTLVESPTWTAVARLADLCPERGVAALVGGRQVALFLVDGAAHAIANFDPFSRAFVLSRGIVGSRRGVLFVASPVYKQAFDLLTGRCLDDPTVRVATFATRVDAGVVWVETEPRTGASSTGSGRC